MRRAWLAALAVAASAVSAAALDVPYLSGRVNDYANLLDSGASSTLEKTLKDYETRTGRQIAVLTIRSLEGLPLEEFSLQTARTWRLGTKGRDDGVLILVVSNDRKVRIEVGYGLEGDLPDALAGRIISDVMIPRFRGGAYAAGIGDGVASVIAALDRSPSSPVVTWIDRWRPINPEKFLGGLLLAFLIVCMDLSEIRTTGTDMAVYFCGALILPLCAFSLSRDFGLQLAIGAFFLHLIGFPLGKLLMSDTAWGRARRRKRGGPHGRDAFFFGSSGGSGGSGGGFSSGGGGFSGGGGSFGGGGASGGW